MFVCEVDGREREMEEEGGIRFLVRGRWELEGKEETTGIRNEAGRRIIRWKKGGKKKEAASTHPTKTLK